MRIRKLTRENFYDVGDWAGAQECWELAAPIPEIRIRQNGRVIRARLGAILLKTAWGVVRLRG